MALNRTIYFPNPLKAKTYGLSDTVRSDAYAYATIYTVTGAETLQIVDGVFQIDGTNDSGVLNEAKIILDISGKEIVLYCNNNIAGADIINTTVTFTDLSLAPIMLATGDTIKIKFIYPDAAGAYTANIKATIFLQDFTA